MPGFSCGGNLFLDIALLFLYTIKYLRIDKDDSGVPFMPAWDWVASQKPGSVMSFLLKKLWKDGSEAWNDPLSSTVNIMTVGWHCVVFLSRNGKDHPCNIRAMEEEQVVQPLQRHQEEPLPPLQCQQHHWQACVSNPSGFSHSHNTVLTVWSKVVQHCTDYHITGQNTLKIVNMHDFTYTCYNKIFVTKNMFM